MLLTLSGSSFSCAYIMGSAILEVHLLAMASLTIERIVTVLRTQVRHDRILSSGHVTSASLRMPAQRHDADQIPLLACAGA